MSLFTRSLWPVATRAPYRRLVTGFVVTPLVLALVLTLITLIPIAIWEPAGADIAAIVVDTGVGLTLMMAAFALSFGLGGVALLWAFSQRGLSVWLATGFVGGAIGGIVIRRLFVEQMPDALMVACALIGAVFFTLLRMIAGVQPDPEPA